MALDTARLRTPAVLFTVVAAVVALAGCLKGDDKDPGAPAGPPADTDPGSPAADLPLDPPVVPGPPPIVIVYAPADPLPPPRTSPDASHCGLLSVRLLGLSIGRCD